MEMYLSKLQEIVEDRGAWHATVHEATNMEIKYMDTKGEKGGEESGDWD